MCIQVPLTVAANNSIFLDKEQLTDQKYIGSPLGSPITFHNMLCVECAFFLLFIEIEVHLAYMNKVWYKQQ